MSAEPVAVTRPQEEATLQEPPEPPRRQIGIAQLLDHLASTARERAEASASADERYRYEEVARLATELTEALAAVPAQAPEPPADSPPEEVT